MNGKIILKKNEERRLLAGHQWIFSNEIESKEVETGVCITDVMSKSGRFLGRGFYNKHSLIAYRHLTDRDEEIDVNFFRRRIIRAYELRKKKNHGNNVFRLVNSESDFLPGLIIDKFDDRYSLQIFSAGMEIYFKEITDVLVSEFGASLIVEKNNNDMRTLEGLELREGILHGDVSSYFECEIDSIKYNVNLLKGQKTGFYLDQAENRKLLREYVKKNYRILDLFCNEGGFALNAAYAGGENITAVDSSSHAVEAALANAELHGFTGIDFITSDVFEFLNSEFQTKNKYDIIILDPPSFTKSRKNINTAIAGYVDLNSKCMRLMNYNSLLFTFSCSHHITEDIFDDILVKSSSKANRKIQLIEKHTCSYDHPVLLQMNETKYLKGYLLRVI